ncbi:MAG: PepSY domain-containing protein, partial [Kiloniellales bacterium]|nr:PepSY domain-containing protein [Kiloniellales bacterium]
MSTETSDQTGAATVAAEDTASDASLYRAIWRWHFYAGLLVLPFMVWLALTGGIYLFKDEINGLLYGDYRTVSPTGEATLPPSEIVARAGAALGGATAIAYIPPMAPDRSAQVRVTTAEGETRVVYVDPTSGTVLGDQADGKFAGSPLMLLVRKLHSLAYFGEYPSRIIEAVGGFALVLVITGFYLWWPRGRAGGVVSLRGKPGRRIFWRDLHAVTGAFAGVLIFFLAITGLPWSGFWGGKVNEYANQAGWGYPSGYWENIPVSTVPMRDAMTETSWSLENRPMPASTPNGAATIGLDRAVAIFTERGIAPGYVVDFPGDETGVFTASVYPDRIAGERIIHLDQYSGEVLFDAGFADLGAVGQAIEWGVSVHMGQEFGLANQLLMLAACLAIIVMSTAAVVMWWKRRPRGRLGVPPYPENRRVYVVLWSIAVVIGLLFPVTGLAIATMVALDLLLIRWVPPLRRAFA